MLPQQLPLSLPWTDFLKELSALVVSTSLSPIQYSSDIVLGKVASHPLVAKWAHLNSCLTQSPGRRGLCFLWKYSLPLASLTPTSPDFPSQALPPCPELSLSFLLHVNLVPCELYEGRKGLFVHCCFFLYNLAKIPRRGRIANGSTSSPSLETDLQNAGHIKGDQ